MRNQVAPKMDLHQTEEAARLARNWKPSPGN